MRRINNRLITINNTKITLEFYYYGAYRYRVMSALKIDLPSPPMDIVNAD